MTTQEKVIRWFYLKEIPTTLSDEGIHVWAGGVSFKLSPFQFAYIAEEYDKMYGPKTNAQIIDDISDAIVYIEGCLDNFYYSDEDLIEYKEMLKGLEQAITLIKQL
jgi:hypothetical protein